MTLLEINGLKVEVAGKAILNGVDLKVGGDEIHAIMGPNGSGKSTLGNALMGSPKCKITGGSVTLNGEDLLSLPAYERAKKGVFLGFQHPTEIQGLKFYSFLKRAADSKGGEKQSVVAFKRELDSVVGKLFLPSDFASREVNHGFSGGEKKRAEVLQLEVLNPRLALLDEIDSGLDVDTLKVTAQEIAAWQKKSGASLVFMTHYKRILDYLPPDKVHVMVGGKIVRSGGREVADEIDSKGYGLENAGGAPGVGIEKEGAGKDEKEFYGSLLKLNKEKAPHAEMRKGGKTKISLSVA